MNNDLLQRMNRAKALKVSPSTRRTSGDRKGKVTVTMVNNRNGKRLQDSCTGYKEIKRPKKVQVIADDECILYETALVDSITEYFGLDFKSIMVTTEEPLLFGFIILGSLKN